ncbi:MAG: hypothetical protein Q8916_12100 [Bacteroidota bacterium]|nr:hypothetical protein [Bacteroidota bacterium]MDP4231134.1 hypothetical protein [Bacteroidota bacterium]MDP4235557.1 hypothetical protein [Bacteroidota bacterium]
MNSDKADKSKGKKSDLPGYPVYSPSQDIYNKESKATNINPDDNSEVAEGVMQSKWNEEDYDTSLSGDDLDVPGAEIDDKEEAVGREDEENNYYSLGGDDHADLDESHGE